MRVLTQTLAEQLEINDQEIAYRKSLLDFQDYESKYLAKAKTYITHHIETLVERFYEKQTADPDIALLIGDSETLARLKSAMRRYILELFGGDYGMDYVNRRLRIGKVHQRIGVPPKLYIGAIWMLQSSLYELLNEAPASEIQELDKAKIKQSLNKLLLLDTQFVFDTYISNLIGEVEVANRKIKLQNNRLEETVALRTQQLEEMSRKDKLTGLLNQHTFYEYLRHELHVCQRHLEPLSLIYFDLNLFKQVNDRHGHQAGDAILRHVGESILASIREIDLACRYGGDEFAVILPRTSQLHAVEIMQRIIAQFSAAPDSPVTLSAGIATTGPENFIDTDELVRQADKLMYASKKLAGEDQGNHITCSEHLMATMKPEQSKSGTK